MFFEVQFITLFQFLIGRVKSIRENLGMELPLEFQFLIGRVKSPIRWSQNVWRRIVSIPYRQSQKRRRILIKEYTLKLFQFLIGRVKRIFKRCHGVGISQFQFLIGRVKSMMMQLATTLSSWGFNSLQVESKEMLGQVIQIPFSRFQFLIGRVKRSLFAKRNRKGKKSFNSLQVESKV